jgi:hypothetical protein
MKKLVLTVLVLSLPGFASTATAHQAIYDLIATGTANTDVGDITLDHDDGHITVTYATADGWLLIETHVQVGQSFEDFPLTEQGGLDFSRFAYTNSHDYDDGLQSFTYTIGRGGLAGEILIVAHAVVVDTSSSMTDLVAFSEPGIDAWGPLAVYAEPGDSAWGASKSAVAAWVHPDWPLMPPAVWISTDEFSEEFTGDNSWRRFQSRIHVEVDGFIVGGTLSAIFDDAAEVYWNGAFIGSDDEVQADVGDNFERNATRDYAIPPMSGINTLDFIVRDNACDPDSMDSVLNATGLIYRVEVESQTVRTAWGGMWADSNDKPADQFPDNKGGTPYIRHDLEE